MTSGVRKGVLTAHICSSLGWLGAVAGFLVLALTALNGSNAERVRCACVAMEVVARFVILPACLASFATGVVQSLGTPWGLVRHHWTLAKLVITALSTVLLLVHMQPIAYLGSMASRGEMAPAALHDVKAQLVDASAMALVALFVATVLSVYKPRGLTWYGRRLQAQ
jgi:hypothetical protein